LSDAFLKLFLFQQPLLLQFPGLPFLLFFLVNEICRIHSFDPLRFHDPIELAIKQIRSFVPGVRNHRSSIIASLSQEGTVSARSEILGRRFLQHLALLFDVC
jgi:hypothetical protein